MPESRKYKSEYYDAFTTQTDDINFYKRFVDKDKSLLELGCGTGRVTFPLSKMVKSVVAVDISEEMLDRAKGRNKTTNIDFVLGDITKIDLNHKVDLIIAPFRVMQALETEEETNGFLDVVRNHLAADGKAILNVFNPYLPVDKIGTEWISNEDNLCGEVVLDNGDTLKFFDRREKIKPDLQVMYPDLIYRRYQNGKLVDEHVNPICMRYFYPDQFINLVESKGFKVLDSWGGYEDEVYGKGPELILSIGL